MSDGYQIKDQHAIYFLTFQVVFWTDIFTRQIYRDILLDSLTYCRKEKGLQLFAYAIMSNHVHLICRSEHLNLSDIIRDFKKFTSYKILESIHQIQESRKESLLDKFAFAAKKNSRNHQFQFWTHENHAVELSTNEMIDQRMNYIHDNPVRAGIVEFPEEYLYSSARNYCGREKLIEIDFI